MAINAERWMQRRSRCGDDVAHLFFVALVTGRPPDVAADVSRWQRAGLPRTYVRGYGADDAPSHGVQMRPDYVCGVDLHSYC